MQDSYYTNLCSNIRFTDDVSFKLLGLVPLFSGAGMLVAVLKSEYTWSPAIYGLAAFGALITLGLFRWELRNIQTCKWLIDRGKAMELGDNLDAGQFYRRAASPMSIGKTEAEKLIYGVTIFTWLLLPWLVYSTAQTRANAPLVLIEPLNNAYILLASLVGVVTVLSMILPVNAIPAPPAK